MKKIILIINMLALIMFVSTNVFADNIITYGKSTYAQVDSKMIFGSLGDEYAVSEFNDLGANDWIPENSFKNVLAYEGYTEAYDYNPSYDGYYADFYNKALPEKDLTKISIRGLGANPRETQDVYVLTNEYNKFSAISQNNRINSNAKRITNNSNRISNNESRLDKLEETQVNIMGEINLVQGRKHKISVYGKYNTNRNTCSEVGIKFTYSIGDSWETKQILKNEKRLAVLEQKLNVAPPVNRTIIKDTKGNIISEHFSISDNNLTIHSKF